MDKPNIDAITKQNANAEISYFYKYYSDIDNISKFRNVFNLLWDKSFLYEKLSLQEIMQKNLIDAIVHEHRTPTQAILGYSEMALVDYDMDNPTSKYYKPFFNLIIRNTNRLSSIILNILNVAKIDNTTFILDKQKSNLVDTINEVIDNYSYLLKTEDIYKDKEIEFEITKDSEKIAYSYIDTIRIYEVLANLFANSIQFIQSSGKISIKTTFLNKIKLESISGFATAYPLETCRTLSDHQRPDLVLIQIRDNGIGISSQILPRLFNKFVSTMDNHIGLSLYFSKYIVESHIGWIWAHNNIQEPGSTFYIALPLISPLLANKR